jgi:hypothetical protein
MAEVVVVWDRDGHEMNVNADGSINADIADETTRELGRVRAACDFVTLIESGARASGTGTGSVVDVGGYREGYVSLKIDDVSGNPRTLDVTIEISPDEIDWETYYAFAQQTQLGNVTYRFSSYQSVGSGTGPFGQYMRILWSIGGSQSPTFNFSVQGTFKA